MKRVEVIRMSDYEDYRHSELVEVLGQMIINGCEKPASVHTFEPANKYEGEITVLSYEQKITAEDASRYVEIWEQVEDANSNADPEYHDPDDAVTSQFLIDYPEA